MLLAKLAGLRVAYCTPFEPGRFPGYAHRRTIGDDHAGADVDPNAEIRRQGAKTYAFVVARRAE